MRTMPKAGSQIHRDEETEKHRKTRIKLKEWQIYVILTVISLAVATVGYMANSSIALIVGLMAAFFCVFGIAYGVLKERSL